MMKLLTWATAGAAFLLLAGGAMAQARPQLGAGQALRDLDLDGNGKITKDEVAAAADQLFARADSNGDGVISKEEFRAVQQQRFAAADTDGDDVITRADLASRLPNLRKR